MASIALDMQRLIDVSVASGDALDVRRFDIAERMNELFEISIIALCDNPDIDFESVAGQAMTFSLRKDTETRTWSGLCSHIEQVAVEDTGLSTYRLTLVPALWLLTQRRNHRMFQLESEIDIVRKLLGEWGVPFVERLSGAYKKRKYRVQYGESDFAFMRRMLEDAGIAFCFEDGAMLALHDAPESAGARAPIAFRDNPTIADREHVTRMHVGRKVRPGKYTVRDHDYRRSPAFDLRSTAQAGGGVEGALERFHYVPGAFLYESDKGEPTPFADDKGRYRTDDKEASALAQRRLAANRVEAKAIAFDTNTLDLAPGTVVSFLDHPKSELAPGKKYLVTRSARTGEPGRWTCACEAVSADSPYKPPLATPKPKTSGVESATVVGPAGEEIHTDEFGRVRVHFHWDRESKMNEGSSCWIHVSQPWGGTGFGGTNLPRIGQEVIVDFLGGDPDRPVIVGRVYTNLQKTPYTLPDNKTQSGWMSRSSPGGGASNYNEIMFEDKKGQELVRMQAEKDLDKLVKHDESVRIGHDRTKDVGHDDSLHVGHDRSRVVDHDETVDVGHDETRSVANDRTRSVGNDETVSVGNDETRSVGHDRSRSVGNDESVMVGNNRSKSVALNESMFVGANQSEQIGADRSVQVGANDSASIGSNLSVTVGKAKTEMVALASAETIGGAKALTVGGAYAVTVGGMMTTNVALVQSENVGHSKSVSVGDKIEIVCGAASIMLEKSGRIALTGTDITINGTQVVVAASEQVEIHGATVKMTGDPIDLN